MATSQDPSPAQKRAQADLATFRAVHGRPPAKGESVKGYSARYRADGTRRRKKAPKKGLLDKAWALAKKHPVAATLTGVAVAGGVTLAASEDARNAVVDGTRAAVALVKS